jgi:electron transport complex protein RnfC
VWHDPPAAPAARRLDLPREVVVPLQDAPDDAFSIAVSQGDSVVQGQTIGFTGTPSSHIGIHAPIAGTVTAVGVMAHPLLQDVQSVEISGDGSGNTAEQHPCAAGSEDDAAAFLAEKGVPLDFRALADARVIFINATDFEPSITSQSCLVQQEQHKIAEGIAALLHIASDAQQIRFITTGDSPTEAALSEISKEVRQSSVVRVRRPYPETLGALLSMEVRSGSGDSAARKCVLLEPAELVAAADAFYRGEPVTEQLVTVAGSAVAQPANVWLRIGTTMQAALERTGANLEALGRLTLGGPLTGSSQHRLDVPVIKKSRGIFAAIALHFEQERQSKFYKRCPCVRCGKCVDVCPAQISPVIISELIEYERYDEARQRGLFSCLECGLCSYVCPSMIPLTQILLFGKQISSGSRQQLGLLKYKTLYA